MSRACLCLNVRLWRRERKAGSGNVILGVCFRFQDQTSEDVSVTNNMI
jgi:hypothetical protein